MEDLRAHLKPYRSGVVNLGTATRRFGELFVNTVNFASATITSLTATLTGNVTGNVTGDVTGNVVATAAAIKYPVTVIGTDSTVAVSAAQSGTLFVATATSGTQTYTLPTGATGLRYAFTCGDAGGEILVNPTGSVSFVGKGFATAAGTGIKNTAASNVVGDACELQWDGTGWRSTFVVGTWATQ